MISWTHYVDSSALTVIEDKDGCWCSRCHANITSEKTRRSLLSLVLKKTFNEPTEVVFYTDVSQTCLKNTQTLSLTPQLSAVRTKGLSVSSLNLSRMFCCSIRATVTWWYKCNQWWTVTFSSQYLRVDSSVYLKPLRGLKEATGTSQSSKVICRFVRFCLWLIRQLSLTNTN